MEEFSSVVLTTVGLVALGFAPTLAALETMWHKVSCKDHKNAGLTNCLWCKIGLIKESA